MKKNKLACLYMICLCFICGTLSACGQKEETPDITDSNPSFGELTANRTLEQGDGAKARELTQEEIKFFDDYLFLSENIGFLLSTYRTPEEIDLNELFYSGAGISSGSLTKEEKADYLKASGGTEIYTDVVHLTTAEIDDYLFEKTGLTSAQMKNKLDWVYSAQTDTWYHQAGDTNIRMFDCVSGTVAGDVYTLHMQTGDTGTGYRSELYETVIKKNGDSYQFVSNRFMEEEGKIEDQSFEITLAPWGKVTFASYVPEENGEPTTDVTFRIIQDGKVLMTLNGVSNDNIRTNQCFLSLDAVSFPDFNSDGYMDLITIASYDFASGPDAGKGFAEARIYSGNEYGYFVYERSMSENANSALAELTVRNVLDFLGAGRGHASAGGQNSAGGQTGPGVQKDITAAKTGTAWKDAYIEILNNVEPYQWSGFTLIYLDDDDVPELVMAGIDEATGNVLVAYTEDGMKENQLNRLYFSYIERGNQLCNSEGLMDYYYDLVLTLQDGQLVLTDQGYYGAEDNSNVQFDEKGERIYRYEWNGKQVTKDEYEKELNAVYDQSKAVPCYDWNELYSAEEMITKLTR
ncbi:MAG: hypothetical protein J1E01_05885 [Acetatifactor sp.]|nr:hypothetical protein [Acetatifactor sp.]